MNNLIFLPLTTKVLYSITSVKILEGNVQLDRTQAMALLKELVANDLVDPSFVSIMQKKPNHYQLKIKCNYNKRIEEFAKNNNLSIEEDEEKKYLLIYKP